MNVKNGKVIKTINGSFPPPTGVNYYEYLHAIMMKGSGEMFPSPTGVNYYELNDNFSGKYYIDGFRPQQGLTIMNYPRW